MDCVLGRKTVGLLRGDILVRGSTPTHLLWCRRQHLAVQPLPLPHAGLLPPGTAAHIACAPPRKRR